MKEKVWDEDDAAHYDDSVPSHPQLDAVRAIVDVLVELAGDGPALEFAIGTGRIGLPLAAQGVRVVGLENSIAMAGRLREKDPDERVLVTIGDMATERVAGSFQLVYLVFNTIGNLTTQERQVACLANAAAHLRPGGFFLIENTVPDLRRLPPGEDARVFAHAPGYVGYDRYTDLVTQQAVSHHFVARGNAVHESTTPWRFVWPSELDLMAQLAGMELHFRWADWDRSPFTGDSTRHVSVWRKVPDPHAHNAHGPPTRSTRASPLSTAPAPLDDQQNDADVGAARCDWTARGGQVDGRTCSRNEACSSKATRSSGSWLRAPSSRGFLSQMSRHGPD